MSFPRSSLQLSAALALALTAACTTADPAAPPVAIERGYQVLTALATDDGATVEFGVAPSGGIVTMEDVPLGVPSPVDLMTRYYHASTLEMYLALAGTDAVAPPALVAAHAIERPGAPPRLLELKHGIASADFEWYYDADCSTDGSWFDNAWQSYGWTWHWYWSTSDYSRQAPSIASKNMQAHLCNNASVASNTHKILRILETGSGANEACAPGTWHYVVNAEVAPQHRRQFRVTADPLTCTYEVEGHTKIGHVGTPNWRLAVMKP